MSDKIDYEKEWHKVCEEKRLLRLENNTLKKDSDYWRKEANKYESLLTENKLKYSPMFNENRKIKNFNQEK